MKQETKRGLPTGIIPRAPDGQIAETDTKYTVWVFSTWNVSIRAQDWRFCCWSQQRPSRNTLRRGESRLKRQFGAYLNPTGILYVGACKSHGVAFFPPRIPWENPERDVICIRQWASHCGTSKVWNLEPPRKKTRLAQPKCNMIAVEAQKEW